MEFAANNQGQTHNLPPLNIPGGLEQTPFLCFATFQSSQAQIWLCPRQIHPEPHLRKTPAASVNAALSPETPAGPNKSQIGCNLEYRESILKKKGRRRSQEQHATLQIKPSIVSSRPGEKDRRPLNRFALLALAL